MVYFARLFRFKLPTLDRSELICPPIGCTDGWMERWMDVIMATSPEIYTHLSQYAVELCRGEESLVIVGILTAD